LAELEADVRRQAQEKGITLAGNAIDDVLTVALFPQIGLKFLENRHNPAAFEPLPQAEAAQPVAEGDVLLILEAMKMETEIRAAQAGTVRGIAVKSGDAVAVGDTLMTLA
ncbi:oxaloacetate decarboxylase, partial [Salmonella enterica subsp. enterica]|nr:oxaloacetate decarboxylase [Salmonella enterica subsp. enterica]